MWIKDSFVVLFALFVGAMTTGSTAGPPTPPPITDVGTWQVNQTDSPNWCIKLTMGTTFNVTYYTSTEVKYSTITLFSNASSSGDCGKEVQYIKLDMGGDLILDLNFTMSGSNVQTKMVQLTYNVGDQAQFPGSNATNPTIETATTTKAQWSVPKGNSYTCMEHNEKIDLDTMVSMMPVNLTVQAFNDAAGSSFGSSQYCAAEAPPPNNIVPIVVGAALAGLVVIVLIAYLIGRKRNKRGYESV